MTTIDEVRDATPADVAAIKAIAVDTGLFAADEVDFFDEMLDGFFDGSLEGHRWIVCTIADTVVGAAYYAPEPFSDRMWNLYFLGVAPGHQGSGAGAVLVAAVEAALRDLGEPAARTLIIETSGVDGFEATRSFYRKQGYDEESSIRDFYGPGDAKVTFWKSLVS